MKPTFKLPRGQLCARATASAILLPLALLLPARSAVVSNDCWTIDARYAPSNWQTAICLPDDWQKTLVGKDGSLLYDYPGPYGGFGTRITFGLEGDTEWLKQELTSARVPIVRTFQRQGKLEILQEAFAKAPLPGMGLPATNQPRQDLLVLHLRNSGLEPASVVPILRIESSSPATTDAVRHQVQLGQSTILSSSEPFEHVQESPGKLVLHFPSAVLAPHSEQVLAIGITRSTNASAGSLTNVTQARAWRRAAQNYWEHLALPYERLQVPDTGVQALLDSSIRNIYQAREIKKGLPAFQVGPTCYRGLWVVDGSFLLEAMTYLGRADETRNGINYLLSFQRPDGGFMLIDGHWKETGIALWAITRHARLTGDRPWLEQVWPKVERGFAFIRKMRTMPAADAPNARLIPDGFSDGGLADKVPEYTNPYWTMAGMRAAVDAARWLGHGDETAEWQAEYDDFLQTFRRAAARDLRTDSKGNQYLPIRMRFDENIPPQKAQWAFLHALFPGKVFAPDDPLVRGNLAMLRSTECEGLVRDTGWLKNGIWNYFASFYAHAWLWVGDGDKAARTLYAFGNHASPLLAWREEQMPVGQGEQMVGDMPHNWASAEFIRLVRHSLLLERDNELHVFSAMPAAWAKPGALTRATDIATEFGPTSLEFRVSHDGSAATLKFMPPRRTPPQRIVLHLDNWSGQTGTVELPVLAPSTKKFRLRSPALAGVY